MTYNHIETILNRFSPWSNMDCWVMCNPEKRPVTIHRGEWTVPKDPSEAVPKPYNAGSYLRWKIEPQDHITNLNRVLGVLTMFPNYGFGLILQHTNGMICYDFDHVIAKDGSIPKELEDFLEHLNTFVEISSSGTGLHAFCVVDGSSEEYDFDPSFCDGKCYHTRFIKMTGNVWKDYDMPIQVIDELDFRAVKRRIGIKTDLEEFSKPTVSRYTSGNSLTDGKDTDWEQILSKANIKFEVISNYKGKKSVKHGRTALWAAKVMCPQAHLHTGYQNRRNQFNPDCAILTLWDDGSSSLKCNHDHCASQLHPNLLLKLWDKIRENNPLLKKRVELKNLMKSLGVI